MMLSPEFLHELTTISTATILNVRSPIRHKYDTLRERDFETKGRYAWQPRF